MNDDNKASLGLTPMRVYIDNSKYSNGCYADTSSSVAITVKWDKHLYPNLYRYAIYVWKGTPSWYVGNILYPVVQSSPLTLTMIDSLDFWTYIDDLDATSYTLTGLEPDQHYIISLSAIAVEGYYSDVYLTTFTSKVDLQTPKILSAEPYNNGILVKWRHYSGFGATQYTLYGWSSEPYWYQGDNWYDLKNTDGLADAFISTSDYLATIPIEINEKLVEGMQEAEAYYFGVCVWIDGVPSNVYVVKMYAQNTWKWTPRGEITQNIDWGTNVVDFETGVKQYQQKYLQPTRTFTATFSGLAKTWYEIRDFIDAHKGNLLPFYLWVDEYDRRVRYAVRFADSKFNPKFQTEVSGVKGVGDYGERTGLARREHVGFEIELAFVALKDRSTLQVVD